MNQRPEQNTPKVNKALYIVTVTLLFAIAVVIAITSAANKRRNSSLPGTETDGESVITEQETEIVPDIETDAPKITEKAPETEEKQPPKETKPAEKPTEKEPAEEADAIPDSFMLPVKGILSKGHDTELQVFSETMNDYRIHTGIDIVCAEGTPVYAAADGTVTDVRNDPMMGYSISVSHGGDCTSVYKNLSDEAVQGIEVGTKVTAGQLIATVGNTAMVELAEEPHLHFEMTVAGVGINPLDCFDGNALATLGTDISYES